MSDVRPSMMFEISRNPYAILQPIVPWPAGVEKQIRVARAR
jgi:hypothetical protein